MTTTEQSPRTYPSVFVRKGAGGWGDGLTLRRTETRNKVLSVTGGGIHPVAQRIADLTGAEAVDGFRTTVPDDEVICAVINCGGTARIGVYPRKRIPTIDVYPGSPGGPLAQFITEDIFVSDVGLDDIVVEEGTEDGAEAAPAPDTPSAEGNREQTTDPVTESVAQPSGGGGRFSRISDGFIKFSSGIGYAVNTLLASGRQAITLTISTILPFMAYVSLLLGFVIYTGVAEAMGEGLKPLAGNPLGLIALGAVVALPFLSPILGPGAAIAQIIGVLMGTQIAAGTIPVEYALPTLFAINGQVGCDFVPVGLALGEAKPETVAVGTPAVLLSRLITSPLAVALAWLVSFGMY
ncbi:PTS sorbitol transporter subunit IIB [Streptomyces ipomoeae]|jgi:PTS system glucitol/sorbitol-specific IIC component|uniref:PTS sorbitol transporter subunit IIB n=2 Tax=Streptomyces ipomoeae TaxID=103232 RepID=A0AAE9B0C4_9ACTN|nr:PTS glucitol/sorbitol transporter subunit IIB [Streptomyces ipomoeae]EKX67793.1 putative PTS system, glucitol/sorbitol-specific, IIBC component [Streptomyces ipomoeae 91-03]MDX2692304.1 PTS glucitol/sorbitol transporter subunit IIB [Streptomyces ipomoeae]MDX2819992.1 PTS glucitol/sorbitol transporter subunit IIB [Streptomyces ipomoeae]MDX2837866.1 PTS glucitol/sorbitol transporter subunit IIB [Streptomyces ipomoeae]MDX2872511.1 PTS glucitol/sorbitol transporter subunit IIB [Streptomyces ipo